MCPLRRSVAKHGDPAFTGDDSLFRGLLEAAPDAMIIVDTTGTIVLVNSQAETVFGYAREELLGKPVEMLVPERFRQLHRGQRDGYFGEPRVRELRADLDLFGLRKNGEEFPAEIRLSPLRTDDGVLAISSIRDVTDRKRLERALLDTSVALEHQERERGQRYLDTADVILLALDVDGRITLVNRYACSLLGRTAEELLGRDWIDTCLPVRVRDALREARRRLLAGELAVVENPILTASGEERLIEWRNTLLRDEAGRVIGTFSSGSDISDRKRAEDEALRHARRSEQAEREFRALFAVNPLPMWIYDATTLQFLEVNDAAIQHYGYERDEFLAMTIKDIRPPPEVDRLLAHLGTPREEASSSSGWRHRVKSGRIIDVDITSHTITFGGRSAVLVVAQDVTDRRRAAEALLTAEERTRFALQSAGVGIWDMDYTTGVLSWSETLEGQYGLTPGTFGGTFEEFVEHIHPDDRVPVLDTLARAMASGSDFTVLNRSVWPDGTVRWLSGAGRINLGEHGKPVRGVGISLDVTERRTLEEQYQQAQKMEAIGRLAGGVAHDFNNLLTVILGHCELLLADLDPDDRRHADIVAIQQAGTRAAGLTGQLLAFSRKQIIEPTLLDLNVVVADLRAMLGRLIGEDVRVVLRLGHGPAPVMADRGQVEQIVMNLAVNARDAMPTGGTLTIETASVELDEDYPKTHLSVTPGPYVMLTVTDTGTGMTPQVQARMFEPFFTTKEPGKGTGLGLATIHGIVARSGGSVNVYSEVGRGTAFKVYLPRADAGAMEVEAPAPIARSRQGAETVLVVEDEEPLRDLARRLLERQGYTVLLAATADEALQLFDQNASIDVLLTDVVMPGASGPELTRQLAGRRPGLKVIYMSGYTEDAIVQHGVLEPGIAFLNKPFTSDALGRKIREVLDR